MSEVMSVTVQQPPSLAAGHVLLVGQGTPPRAGEALKVRLSSFGPSGVRYLDPTQDGAAAWGAGARWFAPRAVTVTETGVAVELGPEATWHLRPHTTYMVRLGDAEDGGADTRVAWPSIRLPTEAPRREDPQPEAVRAPVAAAPLQDAPVEEGPSDGPVETVPEDAPKADPGLVVDPRDRAGFRPEPEPQPEPRSGRGLSAVAVVGWAALFLLLIGGAAAGAWWWFLGGGSALVIDDPRMEMTLDGARRYLRDDPAPEDAVEKAEMFDRAGLPDAAFLIRSHAARRGSAPAALSLAKLYDPASFAPGGVVTVADGDRAAEFYEIAAKQGDQEAMTALAALLRSGLTTRPDAPEAAVFWDNAAAQAREAAAGKTNP
jgi:hypothetical protein